MSHTNLSAGEVFCRLCMRSWQVMSPRPKMQKVLRVLVCRGFSLRRVRYFCHKLEGVTVRFSDFDGA